MKQVYWLIAILFAATCPVLNLYHDGFIDQKWSMAAIAVLAFLLYAFLSHKRMRIGEPVMASAACILALSPCLQWSSEKTEAKLYITHIKTSKQRLS